MEAGGPGTCGGGAETLGSEGRLAPESRVHFRVTRFIMEAELEAGERRQRKRPCDDGSTVRRCCTAGSEAGGRGHEPKIAGTCRNWKGQGNGSPPGTSRRNRPCVKLGMRSIPIATACTIYHKFFCEINLDAYDPYLVAMSSLYLAGKVEEQHLRTRDIINVSNRYFHPGSDPLELDSRFWEIRDSIVQCELLVLRVLRFQVSFQHPHKYLLHYLVSLKNWLNRYSWQRTPVSVTAWALLQDSYHGGLCLRFRAQHIAVAVIHLALQAYGVEVPAEAEAEKPWWQVFSEDLTKPTIDNIVSDLIQIYTMDTEIP